MQTSHPIKLFGAFLGLTIFSVTFYHRDVRPRVSSCPPSATVGGQLCRGKMPKPLLEKAWGQMGAIAYQAAAQVIESNNTRPQPLDETQKQFLRPYFGDLVDRVEVVYDATLMEDWVAASFKINVGQSNAQVYGNKIYIKQPYQPGDLQQIVLLAHELTHCQQYEQLGSLGKFGYEYFKEYKKANENYRDNKLEQEAFTLEKEFARWLSEQIQTHDRGHHYHSH
ncbi:DUF4157 domain-containing protein [Oxynema sp. CENA135]|uniref:eCIS core domain-containing protein n=1 Tax=Oxynema sp. CENA135 TaxID=984206 RepID=UPI001909767E|nr:DUF4157 domain-containing protein [Oxynema sp. CENA135]MBK4729211.1 DUF4157 domain-containing protein [Oxynema sp. CENA135]